jgi:hypothetical protein
MPAPRKVMSYQGKTQQPVDQASTSSPAGTVVLAYRRRCLTGRKPALHTRRVGGSARRKQSGMSRRHN